MQKILIIITALILYFSGFILGNKLMFNEPLQFELHLNSQDSPPVCDVIWQDAIDGQCLGKHNTFIPYDHGNDGTIELITAAQTYHGQRGFWYILKYDPETEAYYKVYTSDIYNDEIYEIAVQNIDGEGESELLVANQDILEVVDLYTFETTAAIDINEGDLVQIRFGDGDNDGEDEIICSSSNYLVFVNPKTFEIENKFWLDAGAFDLGNIDEDAFLEIVFEHGSTYEIKSDEIVEEYDFRPGISSTNDIIFLTEIDGDPEKEAVVKLGRFLIRAYDIKNESKIYDIESEWDIESFIVDDVTLNDSDEILFADVNDVFCYDVRNQRKLWEKRIYGSLNSSLSSGDFDSDGTTELVIGDCVSGQTYIMERYDDEPEWKTSHRIGPFSAIAVEDVDQDDRMEIITINEESDNSLGNSTLTVFDAITKEVEFQSSDSFYIHQEIKVVEVFDHLGDGDMDIVLASEDYLRVIDGNSYVIEEEHNFNIQLDESDIFSMQVLDFNHDDTLDFVIGGREEIYVLNSTTFKLEWSSATLHGFYGVVSDFLIEDVDEDGKDEILVAKDNIFIINDSTSHTKKSDQDVYNCFTLNNWDGSGKAEIIAGTQRGEIHIIDIRSLEVLDTLQISDESIGTIKSLDLNDDGLNDEFILTSGKFMYTLNKNGNFVRGPSIGHNAGSLNGITIVDYDKDGKENVLIGSNYRVAEVSTSCAQCLPFEVSFEKVDNICDDESGMIIGVSSDTSTIFKWDGGTFKDTLHNLSRGTYLVTAINSVGCSLEDELYIYTPLLLNVNANIKRDDTSTIYNDGSITVYPYGGRPPYELEWENGEKENVIDSLAPGSYSLTITDALNCTFDTTFHLFPTATTYKIPAEIKIYPNPTSGNLHIQNDSHYAIEQIQVVSTLGRKLTQDQEFNERGPHFINLKNEPGGSYIIILEINGQYYYDTIVLLD